MSSNNVPITLELNSVDNASAEIDDVNASLNKYKNTAEQAGNASTTAAKTSAASWTEFRSAYSTVLDVARVGVEIWNETTGATVELANNVRQFRDVTGQSAEESSRLVQVLDDYKVSVSAAEMATKKFSKDGLEFNVDTLATLSDQYLKLGTDVERTQFLYDKFGKSGDQFAEIMREGGQAIREANDAISENLILTDESLKAARDYEKALDGVSDSMQGLKVSIGTKLLPSANLLLDVIQAQIDKGFEWQDAIAPLAFIQNIQLLSEAQFEAKLSSMDMAEGMKELGSAAQESQTALEESTISIEELSKANEKYLQLIGNVTNEINSYTQKESDLKKEHAELLAEKEKLIEQGWWAESEKVQALNDKLAENEAAQANNASAAEAATQRRILAMLQEELSVDGLDRRETEFLLKKGQEWGIYSQEAVSQMETVWAEVDKLKAQYDSIPSIIGTTIQISVEGAEALNIQRSGEKDYTPPRRQNAMGGSYMIPQSWGNERFPIGTSDTASGGELITITPRGKDPNAELIAAIMSTRIDYNELARIVTSAAQQRTK